MSRAYIPLKTKLAAALRTMLVEEDGKLVPFVDYETAKQMTEDQILSLFHFDHDPTPVDFGGSDEHHNLVPRPIKEHRIKTAKVDIPRIRKSVRLSARQEEFRRIMLANAGRAPDAPTRTLSRGRPIDGSKRSRYKKKINGSVERRDR